MASAEKMRLYRVNHKEKLNTWERSYYHQKKAEPRRIKNYGDRRCRLCEILLKSSMGGKGTKFYCQDCHERGEARKHAQRLATQRWRDRFIIRKKKAKLKLIPSDYQVRVDRKTVYAL